MILWSCMCIIKIQYQIGMQLDIDTFNIARIQ